MKRSILILAGAAAGTVVPVASVITAIAFIAWICTDKRLDRRVKNQSNLIGLDNGLAAILLTKSSGLCDFIPILAVLIHLTEDHHTLGDLFISLSFL